MPTYTFELTDNEGCEVQHVLPGKYEVCPRCEGVGKHDNPAFSNGITSDEMAEDPDFAEDYCGGRYDVECGLCKGKRVVCVPDEQKCTLEQLSALEEYRALVAEIARDDASERHLRMMESGGH